MLFYDNLVICNDDYKLLMNLYSGRRKMINDVDYEMIINIINIQKRNEELSNQYIDYIQKLRIEKQILCKEALDKIDDYLCAMSQKLKRTLMDIDTLTFITSYNCNFKCFYCYQKNINLPKGRLTKDMVEVIREFLTWYSHRYQANTNISRITISGGEPILPENISVIKAIANNFSDANFTIKTNGYYLSELWEQLSTIRFDQVAISLDGYGDSHMRRSGIDRKLWSIGFKKIIDSMKLVVASGIKLHIASVIDRSNYQAIPEMIYFLEQEQILGNELVDIQFNTVLTEDDSVDQSFHTYEEIFEMKSYFNKNITKYADCALWFPDAERIRHLIHRPVNKQMPIELCRCDSNKPIVMTVLPNGKLAYCNYRGNDETIIGTYFPNFDFDFQKVENFTDLNIHTMKKCRKCKYKLLCLGTCPLGRKNIEAPSCGIFENEYLLDNIGMIV